MNNILTLMSIEIALTRQTLPDYIDRIYSHQLNNILGTAFVTN